MGMPAAPLVSVAADPAFLALAKHVIALGDPVVSLAISASGHVVGMTAGTATMDPGAIPIAGDASGTNAATSVIGIKPAYYNLTVTSGTPLQLPKSPGWYYLQGGTIAGVQIIRMPSGPADRDTVRLIAQGTLNISALTVQDANGNPIGTGLTLSAASSTLLLQFANGVWNKVGT